MNEKLINLRSSAMDFESINDKMIENIEKIYLNFILKAFKIFQVILAGYNASKYKSLQSFREYGWKVSPGPIDNGAMYMDFIFEYHIPHLNSNVEIHMVKELKTGILSYNPFLPHVYMDVDVDKNDVIFDTIKQLENVKEIGLAYRYGNNLISYSIINLVEKYRMTLYYKK
jgi:hypothetical protein